MNGKGDTPRPLSVDTETFSSNWDRIFGKKEKEKKEVCEYSGLPNTETYNAPERSDFDTREYPRVDDDGNPIEWTAC
jgi:hypothetical protein